MKLLQEVENKGGIVKAFEKNYIQDEIKRNFEEKENDLISGKNTMVGVNKFRYDEVPFKQFQFSENERFTEGFELLVNRRISEIFEM